MDEDTKKQQTESCKAQPPKRLLGQKRRFEEVLATSKLVHGHKCKNIQG